jgi:anti-sigma factor RsiW
MENNCPTEQQLSAYHDGQLSPAEQAAIAEHLSWCGACVVQMRQLGQMSKWMSALGSEGLSQIAWHRLHAKLDAVIERGLVRWAWEVSGIAAAILVVASVCMSQLSEPGNATAAVPPWVGAQASADPVLSETPTPAAAWYLTDMKNVSDSTP